MIEEGRNRGGSGMGWFEKQIVSNLIIDILILVYVTNIRTTTYLIFYFSEKVSEHLM